MSAAKALAILRLIGLSLVFAKAFAEPPPAQYLQFSPSATKGALYYPDPALFPNPTIAVIAIHRDSNFLSHIMTREMPKRGFVALGMNTRCDNNEARCTPWESNALDVKQGVEHLRNLPGISKVILLGHSGGGPTMSFYQAVAENGVSFCQSQQKLNRCPDSLSGLPAADGIILWDAHLGNGVIVLRSLNPAVTNDSAILDRNAAPRIDPGLDPFSAANGYDPNGESHYTDAFKEKYFKAQSARMNRLIDIALGRMRRIDAGKYRYPDDDAFVVPKGDGARLMRMDLSIDHNTVRPHRLLRNDGDIEDCCIIESVRPAGQSHDTNREFQSGTLFLTLRSFLSVSAIRSKNSMDDIDYCSSNNSTVCNVQHISAPLLVTAMTGHYFVRNGELIHDNAVSSDKELIFIEGATHGGTPCTACMPAGQDYDGRYDNAIRNNFDFLAAWITARF